MRPTSIRTLILVYLVSGFFGWGILQIWERPLSPWFTLVAFAFVIVFLLWRGREVRKLVAGKETSMTPLGAAQVLATAKAAALFAAILGGMGFSSVVEYWTLASSPLGRENVIYGLMVGASSIVVAIVSLVVERWCEIPPDDEGPASAAAAGA
ncbi:MAG: DUF3180 domain-containing protein [Ruaniaceae bacterium]|nr:DUF3180 domain-containing protein [Ruaniaceae bacterium]